MSAVVGLGAVSGFGIGVDALVRGALAEHSALRPVQRFDVDELSGAPAALVPGYDRPPLEADHAGRADDLCAEFAVLAAREALGDCDPAEVGLVLGTNLEESGSLEALVQRIASTLGLGGPRLAVSTACASGAGAIALGAELVERGDCAAVLAGGADVITPTVYAGFDVIGAMSTDACRPFDERRGMGLGDGAAFCLLERRGAVFVLGSGSAADGHHATQPAPDGRGVARALTDALAHAHRTHVDHVHLHGTGTDANDVPEARGVRAALGEVLVSSTKGLLGHTQGAAGALEVVLSLALRRVGRIPGTTGLQQPRPGTPDTLVRRSRELSVDVVASTNSAFGGVNTALVLGSGSAPVRRRRPVGLGPLVRLGPDAMPRLRGFDPRRVDRSGLLLIGVVDALLQEAELRIARRNRDRVGLIVGQPRAPQSSRTALRDSIERDGLMGMHAASFANALRVAPTGACTRALGLRGPANVVCAGGASGVLALRHALVLAEERDLDAVIAATVDERHGATAVLVVPDAGRRVRAHGLGAALGGRIDGDPNQALVAVSEHRAGRFEWTADSALSAWLELE